MSLRAVPLSLAVEDRLKLEDLLRSQRTPERLRLQCQILLMGAEGRPNSAIASHLKLTRSTVMKWRRRYREGRFHPLSEGRGRSSALSVEAARLDRLKGLMELPPPLGLPAWTIRALAEASALSPATVQRTLASHGLSPNPRRSAQTLDLRKLSGVVDLLGIYLHAPYHAVVLELDPWAERRAPESLGAAPNPGEPAWMFHLHLRSLEGLRQLDGFTTHYTSNFWRFLSELQPRTPGHQLWCLTDAPVISNYLRQLERERPDLHFTCFGPGQEWLSALKTWIIPILHRRQTLGECPSLEASAQALESFIRGNAPDPFLWKSA